MDLSSVSDFGQAVAGQIARHFPVWLECTEIEERYSEQYLVITVPSLVGGVEPLTVDTSGDEVTVSYAGYHRHHSAFDDGTAHDALSFIRQLFDERVVVVTYWRNDQWCGGYTVTPDRIPASNDDQPYANIVKVRSWAGTYTRTIQCEGRG